MTRKEKITLRQHQSTRQLMGIQRITPHGVTTAQGEMIFFLVRPDNLTVQSEEGVRSRVMALANLLRAEPAIELLALDARESFQSNRAFYQARLEAETVPALRRLLQQDMQHLDEIQLTSASAREFLLILRPEGKVASDEGALRQMEKSICDHGIQVRLVDEQDVKRLLSVYYQHDMTTDHLEDVDGERLVLGDA